MKLVSNPETILAKTGVHPIDDFLFATIRMDSSRVVCPILLEDGRTTRLLVRQQELANAVMAGSADQELLVYEPYVTFDRRLLEEVDVAATLADAVATVAEGRNVRVEADFPFFHYAQLSSSERISVTVDSREAQALVLRELDPSRVLEAFAGWRELGVETIAPLVRRTEGLERLAPLLSSSIDTRFTALQRLLGSEQVDGVLVSSPPNYSELVAEAATGVEFAFWHRASERLYSIAPEPHGPERGRPIGRFESLGEAVSAVLDGGRLGIEDEWIGVADAISLQGSGLELVQMSRALGSWRDVRDVEDLPFQLLAARASRYSIETALDHAKELIDKGESLTEMDVYRDYLALIQEFRRDHDIPFAIEPYMVNLHASHRTIYPCLPSEDFVLDGDLECLMLDAGVKISVDGVVLGTSDMGRCLVRGPRAERAYEIVKSIVLDGIVAAIRPGITLSALHEAAMVAVAGHRSELESLGYITPEADFEGAYSRRNAGHLMGKQESFSHEIRPGSDFEVTVGTYGAAELPWIFGDIAVTYEDLWFVDSAGTVIVSQ